MISSNNTGLSSNDVMTCADGTANIESNNVSRLMDISTHSALNDSILSGNRE